MERSAFAYMRENEGSFGLSNKKTLNGMTTYFDKLERGTVSSFNFQQTDKQ